MIISFKGRQLNSNKYVEVYRNLHDKDGTKKYSIRQNGLVIGHSNLIFLNNAKFVVRQTGRERVIKEKRKNVHAFIKGFVVDSAMGDDRDGGKNWPIKVTYNPYRDTNFVSNFQEKPIFGALAVKLDSQGAWAAYTY